MISTESDIQTLNRQFSIKMFRMFTVTPTMILMRNEIYRVHGPAFRPFQLVDKRLHLYDTAYIESAQTKLFILLLSYSANELTV
jgi:hypothetical protein